MGSEELRYGIRHRSFEDDRGKGVVWLLIPLALAVGVTFVALRGCSREPADIITDAVREAGLELEHAAAPQKDADVSEAPERPPVFVQSNVVNRPVALPAPVRAPTVPPEARTVERWLKTADTRPAPERTLLERLAAAERQHKTILAIDTIEKLRARPAMADLDDPLARRLGDLNMKMLFSAERTPWTTTVTVRSGDKIHRLAREHGTTVLAVRLLNGKALGKSDALKVGQRLRLLNFPKATFVAHLSLKYGDLMVSGKLFKRFYFSYEAKPKSGAYPITRESNQGPHARLTALGLRMSAADQRELEMFLAPGATITVSEM